MIDFSTLDESLIDHSDFELIDYPMETELDAELVEEADAWCVINHKTLHSLFSPKKRSSF